VTFQRRIREDVTSSWYIALAYYYVQRMQTSIYRATFSFCDLCPAVARLRDLSKGGSHPFASPSLARVSCIFTASHRYLPMHWHLYGAHYSRWLELFAPILCAIFNPSLAFFNPREMAKACPTDLHITGPLAITTITAIMTTNSHADGALARRFLTRSRTCMR